MPVAVATGALSGVAGDHPGDDSPGAQAGIPDHCLLRVSWVRKGPGLTAGAVWAWGVHLLLSSRDGRSRASGGSTPGALSDYSPGVRSKPSRGSEPCPTHRFWTPRQTRQNQPGCAGFGWSKRHTVKGLARLRWPASVGRRPPASYGDDHGVLEVRFGGDRINTRFASRSVALGEIRTRA
jgi:hypothetical protein